MKKYVKPLLLLIAALIFLADRQFVWSAYLSDAGNLQFLQNLVQENLLLAVLVYIVLTIIGCVVLALPGITFAVFAGLLFVPCPDKGGLVLEKSLVPFLMASMRTSEVSSAAVWAAVLPERNRRFPHPLLQP